MKQTIILISMLWTLSASAQFHTIGRGYSNIEKPISKSDTAAITKGAPPEDRGKSIQSDCDSFDNNWIHPAIERQATHYFTLRSSTESIREENLRVS